MFDPDRLPELKSLVREATRGDSGLLDEVMRDVVLLMPSVTTIQPRNINSISLVSFELLDPPGRLADGQFAGVVDDGHAGAVIAPILQTPQAAQQVVDRLPGADITDDSAHRCPSFRL